MLPTDQRSYCGSRFVLILLAELLLLFLVVIPMLLGRYYVQLIAVL